MTEHHDAEQPPAADGQDARIPDGATETADEVALEAFDLDGNGHISLTEDVRAALGILDARAEELAEEPGLKGKAAGAAHHLLDKLDND